MRLSSNDLPINDFLANNHDTAIPGIKITTMQIVATFTESHNMASSLGLKYKR
jgi:hypothetical protein